MARNTVTGRGAHYGALRHLGVLVLCMVLVGCRGGASVAAGVQMSLEIVNLPATVGETTLQITLRDADGAPIDNAQLDIRGDMNEAGMLPVLRDASESINGVYRVPFEWTMTGDWFVIVTATLPDGITVEQQFDLTVN